MKIIYKVILLTSLLFNTSYAQMIFNRDTSLSFFENGLPYKSALDGGINSGQFSNIDLNLDGVMDLIVFDRSGNKLNPYINNNGNYIYAPKYRNNFPKIHDWILMRDYNLDGKNDIFTYSSGGMAVYLNTSNNVDLEFTEVTQLVLSDYGSNFLNIYISPVDIPAISDIDYDGDLDVLTFSILGGFVEYHKNQSMELYGNCDSLIFEFSESCWGLFYEGLNSYILNCQNCQCPQVNSNYNAKQKHAGSTILAIDIDNDNDKDLILGDISYNNLNILVNGGDSQNAFMVDIDSIFPQNFNNTLAANIQGFPAGYYIDVTSDGIKDLIVTTNSQNNSENYESCWLYENNGQNNEPNFNFIQNNFLQADMLDFGTSAFPVFYDYNNDGLEDLIIGNYGYHNANNDPTSSLALLENTGNDSIPSFNLIDRDWLNISAINLNTSLNIPALNLKPTFGDLDGDNNKDLILGDADGKLHLFTNIGNNNFQLSNPNFQNIDIGQFAQPQLIDVNRDGLIDIIIGEQDGTINFLPNNGSSNNAIFDTIIENWGGIDVDQSYISTGFSSPFLYDSSGVYILFVGSYSGNIYQFSNIENNIYGQFTELNSTVSSIWDGGKSALTLKDINSDNSPEMIIGNLAGGISYFSSDSLFNDTTISYNNNTNKNLFTIYPNPNQDKINISSTLNGEIKIYNLNGKIVKRKQKISEKETINISDLDKGIYLIKFLQNTKRFIIN
ncbi:MAG: T9SS type A sorting domain-containing protein [Bacteroidota bacterium]|nr:T9SS type A sorting domain-containing protein [Bacteroidota bacterium]